MNDGVAEFEFRLPKGKRSDEETRSVNTNRLGYGQNKTCCKLIESATGVLLKIYWSIIYLVVTVIFGHAVSRGILRQFCRARIFNVRSVV